MSKASCTQSSWLDPVWTKTMCPIGFGCDGLRPGLHMSGLRVVYLRVHGNLSKRRQIHRQLPLIRIAGVYPARSVQAVDGKNGREHSIWQTETGTCCRGGTDTDRFSACSCPATDISVEARLYRFFREDIRKSGWRQGLVALAAMILKTSDGFFSDISKGTPIEVS